MSCLLQWSAHVNHLNVSNLYFLGSKRKLKLWRDCPQYPNRYWSTVRGERRPVPKEFSPKSRRSPIRSRNAKKFSKGLNNTLKNTDWKSVMKLDLSGKLRTKETSMFLAKQNWPLLFVSKGKFHIYLSIYHICFDVDGFYSGFVYHSFPLSMLSKSKKVFCSCSNKRIH